MYMKLAGALFIILGCGSFGVALAASHKREERMMRKLIGALDYMECELQYRMTALPELFREASREVDGVLQKVFIELSNELENYMSNDVDTCMQRVLQNKKELPQKPKEGLHALGRSVGRFDIEGQLKGLEAVRQECRLMLSELSANGEVRRRNYQTLGLCAGAALVIILM